MDTFSCEELGALAASTLLRMRYIQQSLDDNRGKRDHMTRYWGKELRIARELFLKIETMRGQQEAEIRADMYDTPPPQDQSPQQDLDQWAY